MRRICDEVLSHRLEPHLARDVADKKELLAFSVRNDLQGQVTILRGRRADRYRVGEVSGAQIAREVRMADQVVDTQTQVGGASQIQEPGGHAVEPHDLSLPVQHDDPVRECCGGTLQLADELDEPLFVKPLAPMQSHELGNDVAPHSADVGRIGVAAVTQPPVCAE